MMKRQMGYGLLVLVLAWLLVACGASATSVTPTAEATAQPTVEPTSATPGVHILEPKVISDVTLTNQEGAAWKMSDERGKVMLISFGYTNCPDVCPINLARFKQVKGLLGDSAADVQFVFVTVDGARDTPERLKFYLAQFDPTFLGLSSDEPTARSVIDQFGGTFILNNSDGLKTTYTVDHTASTFLMNRDGQWVRTYDYNIDPHLVADDILDVVKA